MAPVNPFDRSCKGFDAFNSCWTVAELPFYDSSLSAMNPLLPTPQKAEDLISIYSHGMRDFYQ